LEADDQTESSKSVDPDLLLRFYREMLLIRRFEEKAGQLYGMGLIAGFCHLYIGQEAVVVGLQDLTMTVDTVITSYRDHGHMLACGMDPGGVMAELTGREGGYSKGKGGSMHMFSREKNFFGGHGIVGAQAPILSRVRFTDRCECSTSRMISSFSDAGYLIYRPPHPRSRRPRRNQSQGKERRNATLMTPTRLMTRCRPLLSSEPTFTSPHVLLEWRKKRNRLPPRGAGNVHREEQALYENQRIDAGNQKNDTVFT